MSKQQDQEQKVQEHQVQYNRFQERLSDLQGQLLSVVPQAQEHAVVDKTLAEIPAEKRADRACYKMIGGVLVKKSVDDVLAILREEATELASAKTALEKEFATAKAELNTWMQKNKVRIVRQ